MYNNLFSDAYELELCLVISRLKTIYWIINFKICNYSRTPLNRTSLNRNDRRKNRIIIFRDRGDEKKLATMFAASNAFLLPLPRIPVPAFRPLR
ncbi:hypothetical protein C0J52_15148 [Blattella germanica]|nr:hypothetical protein C0J52_15148 [Blattella germanica]